MNDFLFTQRLHLDYEDDSLIEDSPLYKQLNDTSKDIQPKTELNRNYFHLALETIVAEFYRDNISASISAESMQEELRTQLDNLSVEMLLSVAQYHGLFVGYREHNTHHDYPYLYGEDSQESISVETVIECLSIVMISKINFYLLQIKYHLKAFTTIDFWYKTLDIESDYEKDALVQDLNSVLNVGVPFEFK
jgi:hypothetical protein